VTRTTEKVDSRINSTGLLVLIAVCDKQGTYSSNTTNLATYLNAPVKEVTDTLQKLYYNGYIKKTANPHYKNPFNRFIKPMQNRTYFKLTNDGEKILEFFDLI
jgi:DNA-binding MarR family transcriptional regulator